MRTLSTCLMGGVTASAIFVVVAACQPKNQDANTMPPNGYTGYPPGQTPPGYPPGQVPPGYPTATAPTAMPTPMAAPSGSAAMAVPGPIAFQCQNDVPCGTHHCNMAYGKCAFPCQSAADCIPPNSCLAGLCLPAPPTAK